MSLAAGRLRHRIQFEAKTDERGSSGARSWTWNKIENGDDWADIQPLSARELQAADAAQSKVTARIIVRFRADVTAAMRVRCGDQIYSIEGIIPDKESGRESLTIAASSGINNGP